MGTGFLAGLCRDWEEATEVARDTGIRVVILRFGLVLSGSGGALHRMLPLFRMGLGGRIGTGRQWMSWIALDDAVGIIRHVIEREDIEGPVNAVAPNPATNRQFAKSLGKVLRRPAFIPVPTFVAEFLLGEMADELLLSSARVSPKKLTDSGYTFKHRQLEAALQHALGRE